MKQLMLQAPAKINLTLDILRRREDGYHDLQMVMQSISLCDRVTLEVGEEAGKLTICLPGSDLPAGPDNIAWKAAEVFFRETGITNPGMTVIIEKKIPAQAGMAGGSTDGAAVLRGLRLLFCPELPVQALERMGEQVGSDVPFCVRGGTALAEGRGERLTDLPALPDAAIVVCKPNFGLPTPALFRRVKTEQITHRVDGGCAAVEQALQSGDLPAVAAGMENVFEQFLLPKELTEIEGCKAVLRRCGALGAVMTGSGPTVFGIFRQEDDACHEALCLLRQQYPQTILTHPLSKQEIFQPEEV